MKQERSDQIPANRPENKEPAEGSRETVGASDKAGGITNRPLDREKQEQSDVPPRGKTKDEAPGDAGRTAGGGSLGHRESDAVRRDHDPGNATGSDGDPAMPQDDATLKTKI